MPVTTTSETPARVTEETAMDEERDPSRVDEPSGQPPDAGLAYDPAMTDTDEANIPDDSDVDPGDDGPPDRDEGDG